MAKEFVGQEYMAATNGKGLHQHSKEHRILARTTLTFSVAVTLLSVFIVLFCIFFQLCPVNGSSMMMTLNATGDNTNSALTTIIGTPERGNIVVMKLYMTDTHMREYVNSAAVRTANGYTAHDANGYYKLIVKRLIAKGGDRISMRRVGTAYYIYVNEVKLEEDYLDPMVSEHEPEYSPGRPTNFGLLWNLLRAEGPNTWDMEDWVHQETLNLLPNTDPVSDNDGVKSDMMLVVPDGYYFVMGDNRGSMNDIPGFAKSWDSTAFGPLPSSSYYSHCVDILRSDVNMPQYLWQKFVYYVCFGWLWQK